MKGEEFMPSESLLGKWVDSQAKMPGPGMGFGLEMTGDVKGTPKSRWLICSKGIVLLRFQRSISQHPSLNMFVS